MSQGQQQCAINIRVIIIRRIFNPSEIIRIVFAFKEQGVHKSFSHIFINFFKISKGMKPASRGQKKKKAEHADYTEKELQEIDKEYNELMRNHGIQESYGPKIQNVVSTVLLELLSKTTNEKEETLDLDNLANKSNNCEYKKSRFPALIQRIKDPKSTALIFEAGKMVITGTKSIDQSRDAAQKFAKSIEKVNKIKINIVTVQTSNIVANSQLPYEVNLIKINEDKQLQGSINYDRQAFPGLIYKMQNPKLAALIFFSGKIVFTGAKNEHQIKKAYCTLTEILKKHESIKTQKS
ncbi:hypothetical protein pb186bvf_000093 [Paramecium bursaria]